MEEIDRLQQALEDKDRELRELQASYDDFMESSKELEQELERELENESQKCSELGLRKQILEEKLEELHHKYNTAIREALNLQDELDKARTRCRELEVEKRNLEQQNDEALARVRVCEATEADLRYKLERAIEDTVFAQSDIDELRRQKEESELKLRREVDDTHTQLRAARIGSHPEDAANRSAPADVEYYESLESSVEELQVKLQEAEDKNDELTEELVLLEEEMTHAKQETEQRTVELENVRKEYAALDSQMQEGERRVEELVAEVTNLTDELINKGQEIRMLQDNCRDYSDLQTKGARLEESLKLKSAEVDLVKLQLATLTSEFSEKNDKVCELDRLNSKLKSLNDELEAQNRDLTSQLETKRSAARRRSTLRIDTASPQITPRALPVPEEIETELEVTPQDSKEETKDSTAEDDKSGRMEDLIEENARLIEENATLLHKNENLRNELQLRMERRDHHSAVVISPARIPTLEDLVGDAGSAAQAVRLAVLNGDVMSLAAQIEAMQAKYERQRSHNAQLLLKLQHMKGNIQVCCRVRPPTDIELSQKAQVVVEALGDTEVGYYDHRSLSWRSFAFDKVWGPDQSQQDIFCDVEPLALSVVDGFNACIFAYGQTGSGKTHTMIGSHPNHGVSVRTLHKIFDLLQYRQSLAEQQQAKIKLFADEEESDSNTQSSGGTVGTASDPKPRHFRTRNSNKQRKVANLVSRVNEDEAKEPNPNSNPDQDPTEDETDSVAEPDPEVEEKEIKAFEFSIRVSMLEIYNDEVRDLLNPSNTDLDIRQTVDGYVQVPGLERECVSCIGDVMRIFEQGNANRAVAATNVHAHSSRSHSILVVDVDTSINSAPPVTGRLCLVDLAGSEKVSKSMVTGAELKEAQHINKSLSALGDVMEALDSKAKHIPYRNSKLTYLLQDSLGGNSHTLMIVTVCPTSATAEETSFTLQFATRVRRIQLGTATRNVSTKNLEETLKQAKNALKLSQRQKIKLEEELTAFKREQKRNQQKMSMQMDARSRSNDDQKKTLELQAVALRESKLDLEQRLLEERRKSEKVNEQLEATSRKLQRQEEQTKSLSKERDSALERLRESEKEISSLRQQIRANASSSRTKRTPAAASTASAATADHSNSIKLADDPPPAVQASKGRTTTPRTSANSGDLGPGSGLPKGLSRPPRPPSPNQNEKASVVRSSRPPSGDKDQTSTQTHTRNQSESRMTRPRSSTRLSGEEKPAHPKLTHHSRGVSHDSIELSSAISSLAVGSKSRPASPVNPNPNPNPSPTKPTSSAAGPERAVAAVQKHRERLKKVREQK